MSLELAAVARLAGDATLTAALATYLGAPAISTHIRVPEDMGLPYLWCPANVSRAPSDTKVERGFEVFKDWHCVAQDTGSSKTIRLIAERVYDLFHRAPLAGVGSGMWLAQCSGPTQGESGEEIIDLIVGVRWVYWA